MNRRQFLHPRRLANVAGPVLGVAAEGEPTEASTGDPAILRFGRRAMATTFEVILPFETPSSHDLAQAALDEIDRLEAQLTVFRDSSEVCRLNARAADHPVRVEQNLLDLLALAAQFHGDTDGAFDVSVGALIKTWGFFRREGRVPTPRELAAVRERIGMNHVVLDSQRQTVFFQRPGLEINLGSIGKGYTLDRAAQLVDTPNVLLHGGHSSVLARGNETSTAAGWSIGLTDPERPQCRRAVVRLRNRGMATSAATFQFFEHEGRKLGHILDPRTAWPAEGMLSATVTAPTAALADALATAFFILGIEKSREYCDRHPEIGAVLIAADSPHRLMVLGRAAEEVEILR
ncbi:MAG: FAD:protein FMN transferase [Planctomycetes bacterium]|nr:FAD:protein FMN transferase [Planctomycetota bacterium]